MITTPNTAGPEQPTYTHTSPNHRHITCMWGEHTDMSGTCSPRTHRYISYESAAWRLALVNGMVTAPAPPAIHTDSFPPTYPYQIADILFWTYERDGGKYANEWKTRNSRADGESVEDNPLGMNLSTPASCAIVFWKAFKHWCCVGKSAESLTDLLHTAQPLLQQTSQLLPSSASIRWRKQIVVAMATGFRMRRDILITSRWSPSSKIVANKAITTKRGLHNRTPLEAEIPAQDNCEVLSMPPSHPLHPTLKHGQVEHVFHQYPYGRRHMMRSQKGRLVFPTLCHLC
ncbi:hypothetical protein Bbelb_441490, partial [Branchiostoma belcheri]